MKTGVVWNWDDIIIKYNYVNIETKIYNYVICNTGNDVLYRNEDIGTNTIPYLK